MHLYVGKSHNEEHINLIPDKKTIELCESLGFKVVRIYKELLSFIK